MRALFLAASLCLITMHGGCSTTTSDAGPFVTALHPAEDRLWVTECGLNLEVCDGCAPLGNIHDVLFTFFTLGLYQLVDVDDNSDEVWTMEQKDCVSYTVPTPGPL